MDRENQQDGEYAVVFCCRSIGVSLCVGKKDFLFEHQTSVRQGLRFMVYYYRNGVGRMKPSELFTKITNQTGLYNIQPIENISSIMSRGLLCNERAARITHKSIAMPEIQERRNGVFIPNGMALHKYANLYFDPRNPMLYKRKAENEKLCILKFDSDVLDIDGVIVSDRNASSGYASFYPPEIGLSKIDFTLVYATNWTDFDEYIYYKKKSAKCAEVLIPYMIPFYYVVCAAVYNETAKQNLEKMGFDRRIFVNPEFFF